MKQLLQAGRRPPVFLDSVPATIILTQRGRPRSRLLLDDRVSNSVLTTPSVTGYPPNSVFFSPKILLFNCPFDGEAYGPLLEIHAPAFGDDIHLIARGITVYLRHQQIPVSTFLINHIVESCTATIRY